MSLDKILHWYDLEVGNSGRAGVKVAESIEVVAARVIAERDGLDLPSGDELLAAWVGSAIKGERDSRARRRMAYFQQVHDALAGLTVMGDGDPILDVALRTGSADGLDKSLRHWGVRDWLDVLGASASNVSDAISADRDIRALVNPIVAEYAPRGAATLGDML